MTNKKLKDIKLPSYLSEIILAHCHYITCSILHKFKRNSPRLTLDGEIWVGCYECNVWFMFCQQVWFCDQYDVVLDCVMMAQAVYLLSNSLWPSDTIWWQRSGSTLSPVMDCYLTASSHYLMQCWFVTEERFSGIQLRAVSQKIPQHSIMYSPIVPFKSPKGQ